jgi:hypothetical protein
MKRNILLGATAIAFNSSAFAVEPAAYTTESGVVITPIVAMQYKYDDNIYNQGGNTQGSEILTLSPTANFLLDDGINNYQIDVGLESGSFFNNSDDNYLEGFLHFNTHLEASSTSRLDISLEANKEVERRGSGITEGSGAAVAKPLSYNNQLASLTYEYGGLSSPGRIALSGSYYNKNYTNFSELTEAYNYNRYTLGSTFYYSSNDTTDIVFDIKGGNTNYDLVETSSRDSSFYTALVGIQWEATALTSGSFKIGQEEKSFSDEGRESFKGIGWEANVDWKPLTYSTLSLETSRRAKEPDTEGDYIKETVYSANWAHSWSELLSTNVNYTYVNEDYTSLTNRLDKTNALYIDVNYKFKRWVDVALFIEHLDKDSTNDSIIYDKSIVGLNFTFSL